MQQTSTDVLPTADKRWQAALKSSPKTVNKAIRDTFGTHDGGSAIMSLFKSTTRAPVAANEIRYCSTGDDAWKSEWGLATVIHSVPHGEDCSEEQKASCSCTIFQDKWRLTCILPGGFEDRKDKPVVATPEACEQLSKLIARRFASLDGASVKAETVKTWLGEAWVELASYIDDKGKLCIPDDKGGESVVTSLKIFNERGEFETMTLTPSTQSAAVELDRKDIVRVTCLITHPEEDAWDTGLSELELRWDFSNIREVQ